MPKHAVTAAGEAMPAGNILASVRDMLESGDVSAAITLLDNNRSEPVTAAPPAAKIHMDMNKMYDAVEDICSDVSNLQRITYLLMGDLEEGLSEQRGKVDGTCVTLMFQSRGIDVTQWLAGKAWSDTVDLEEKTMALLRNLEAWA